MKKIMGLLSFFLLSIGLINCGGSQTASQLGEAEIPEWYIEKSEDPNYIYAAATAISKDMQLAFDKASTDARTEIGRKMQLKLEALQKSFKEEVGGGDESQLLQQFTQASKIVVSTELVGSDVVKKSVGKEGKGYRAYVLIKYPIGSASEAFMKQISKQKELYTRFRSSEAFKELQNDVDRYEEWKKNN